MGKIRVYKYVRLGQDGDKFKKDLIAHQLRTNAKVDEDYVNNFNKQWETSGHLYILNEEATKERDEAIKKSETAKKEPENVADVRNALKKEADDLGIIYPKNIKNEKLAELISEKRNEI